MDLKHFQQRLFAKERELLADIARFENEAREAGKPEVGDPTDHATLAEGKSTFFEESNLEWQTLIQVRDALQRVQRGTYGTCVDCGRPIGPARLEAIPWTPYCLEDQDRRDKRTPVHGSSTL